MSEGDRTLDCTGLICPLPVLRARKALMAMPSGAILTLLATDEGARRDVPAFCQATGHTLLAVGVANGDVVNGDVVNGVITFTIRRA